MDDINCVVNIFKKYVKSFLENASPCCLFKRTLMRSVGPSLGRAGPRPKASSCSGASV